MDSLGERFLRFTREECGTSPLYAALSLRVAYASELLGLAAHGTAGPKPNLFLAAVHYLLLSDSDHPLAAFYPTVSGSPVPDGDPFPLFREFCLQHAEGIRRLMETRLVQTNEVARAALLLPAFNWLFAREHGRLLGLVEAGASAGLLLLWDRYGYSYDGQMAGDATSPVRIPCEVRGQLPLPLHGENPVVASAVGVDLHPVDVSNPDDVLWLRALVWPDQPERMDRLRAALELARRQPPRVVAGDAVGLAPRLVDEVAADAVPVVFHCHTLNQFPDEARRAFRRGLMEHSRRRRVYELSLEGTSTGGEPEMRCIEYASGERRADTLLAVYHPHGRWIEWKLREDIPTPPPAAAPAPRSRS